MGLRGHRQPEGAQEVGQAPRGWAVSKIFLGEDPRTGDAGGEACRFPCSDRDCRLQRRPTREDPRCQGDAAGGSGRRGGAVEKPENRSALLTTLLCVRNPSSSSLTLFLKIGW